MTDVQEKPTLTFEGKNYIIEDLSDRQRYLTSQIQNLMQQANEAKARLDQIDVAQAGFEGFLRTDLEENPEGVEIAEGEIVE